MRCKKKIYLKFMTCESLALYSILLCIELCKENIYDSSDLLILQNGREFIA